MSESSICEAIYFLRSSCSQGIPRVASLLASARTVMVILFASRRLFLSIRAARKSFFSSFVRTFSGFPRSLRSSPLKFPASHSLCAFCSAASSSFGPNCPVFMTFIISSWLLSSLNSSLRSSISSCEAPSNSSCRSSCSSSSSWATLSSTLACSWSRSISTLWAMSSLRLPFSKKWYLLPLMET